MPATIPNSSNCCQPSYWLSQKIRINPHFLAITFVLFTWYYFLGRCVSSGKWHFAATEGPESPIWGGHFVRERICISKTKAFARTQRSVIYCLQYTMHTEVIKCLNPCYRYSACWMLFLTSSAVIWRNASSTFNSGSRQTCHAESFSLIQLLAWAKNSSHDMKSGLYGGKNITAPDQCIDNCLTVVNSSIICAKMDRSKRQLLG